MSSFAAWGLTILGLAVVTTVAEMLLPQGKTRNVIRSVAATIAVLVIVTPLPGLFKNGLDFDFSDGSVEIDENYLDYIEQKKCETVSEAAQKYLEQNGYSGIRISVELDGFRVKSAVANFVDSGITGDGAHINKSEIKRLLAEYFGIDKEAVMAYG